MFEKNHNTSEQKTDTVNIFDEFSQNEKIVEEVKNIEKKEEKDTFYYLKIVNSGTFTLNVFSFFLLALLSVYIYIQTDTDKKQYWFLSPVCQILLGDMSITDNMCYGVTPILSEFQTTLSQEELTQAQKILPVLGDMYSIKNFNSSKKVSFLLSKNEERLKPLEILSSFDALKSKFAPIDKKDVHCSNIEILEGNQLKMSCDFLSSDWDNQIVTLRDGNISFLPSGGTSISRASSFLNFIEKSPNSPFRILEKTKTLTSEESNELPYTRKTTIDFKLQYEKPSNISS